MPISRSSVLLWFALVVSPAVAIAATPIELALAREAAGDLPGAVTALEQGLATSPDDYALHLQLAWTLFRLERYAPARVEYQRALDLSRGDQGEGSVDARLGLAWTQCRLGEREAAATGFLALKAENPDLTAAEDGLTACPPTEAVQARLGLAVSYHQYTEHPSKVRAVTVSPSLDLTLFGRVLVGGAYRFGNYWEKGARGQGRSSGGGASFVQHEVYGQAGWSEPFWGVTANWALALDGSDTTGTTHFVGGSARLSPLGDIVLDASFGLYSDLLVPRLALSWHLPFAERFAVTPGAALQPLGDELLTNLFATASVDLDAITLLAGGKYGPEDRPAYLSQRVVYNVPERLAWGVWGGIGLPLGDDFELRLDYEFTRFALPDGAVATPAGHFITLGAVGGF